MSRFRGYRSIWSMCLSFALKGPRISTFRRRNPLELETPNLDWVFDGPDGVPSERTRNPRADRAPERRFSFGANQQKHSSDLRPPLSGRSIPLLFFKARARQQKLEPPAIGPWRRPAGDREYRPGGVRGYERHPRTCTSGGAPTARVRTSLMLLLCWENCFSPAPPEGPTN